MTKRGFTLLELTMVIFVVGILSALGFAQFGKMIEKGRTAEAKRILGEIRQAEEPYYLNNATYTTSLSLLGYDAPPACVSTHYFSYTIIAASALDFTAEANRCTAGGKFPNGPAYNITLDYNGNWGGSSVY